MSVIVTEDRIQNVLGAAVRAGIFEGEPPLAVFYDLERFRAGLRAARDAFPVGTLHALAVKANPVGPLLALARDMGFGAECASAVEVAHALALGFAPERVVFDSPAKTAREIALALDAGVALNMDNLQELAKVAEHVGRHPSRSVVGLRVNPSVGAGTIASTSTAVPTSKFGVTLDEHHDRILDAFRTSPWLRALHVHVGSQGCPLELCAQGVRRVVDLASEIERELGRPIEVLDIGGGLPVSYDDDGAPAFAEYARVLGAAVPGIFSGRFRLVTEFGRAVSAKAAWVASRVEYTKIAGGRRIAVVHAGADLFLRAAYQPEQWRHRVSIHDPSGAPRSGPEAPWDIAGPLCFSGDLVARERPLPDIEPGDIAVVHDAGAYTLSAWSRYNSRRAPAVYGFEGDPPALRLLKAAESEEDVLRFWG
jgi:diaminopimelate decarboxylase